MDLGLVRVGVAHHVAVHITAGGEGVEESLIDLGDGSLEIALNHPVELERLAGRQLNRSVGVLLGNAVHVEPLLRSRNTTGHTHADHERVGGFQLLFAAFPANVAIVLLVDSVELRELLVIGRQRTCAGVGQSFENGSAQVVTGIFDAFVGCFSHFHVCFRRGKGKGFKVKSFTKVLTKVFRKGFLGKVLKLRRLLRFCNTFSATLLPMRLPLKTEYACQMLAQLALTYSEEGVRQVEDLAAAENLSPNYSVQILTTLRQAGLVISRRGKNGGYLLAKHPDEISLADIALAMEGGSVIESSPGNDGMSSGNVHAAWVRVNEALLENCREIKLSELVATADDDSDWMI